MQNRFLSRLETTNQSPSHKKDQNSGAVPAVRSIIRAANILSTFSKERPYLSLTEVAEATGLDKGTARRLLLTLQRVGLVDQSPNEKRYHLTIQVLRMASAIPEILDIRVFSLPILQRLAETTGASSFLSILHDRSALCVQQYSSNSLVEVRWPIGSTMPLNCGAGPRVLLAFLPLEEQEHILRQYLGKMTTMSVDDPDKLRPLLAPIRERGWESCTNDVLVGVMGVGAPVRNTQGEVIAAVSVSGLISQLQGIDAPRHLNEVLQAAHEISEKYNA